MVPVLVLRKLTKKELLAAGVKDSTLIDSPGRVDNLSAGHAQNVIGGKKIFNQPLH